MIYLVGSFLLFVILLLVVVFFVFKKSKNSDSKSEASLETVVKKQTLESLIEILKKENKDLKKVEETLAVMLKFFPFPEKEKDANEHFKFVYFFAKNPLPSAKLVVKMQKMLCEKNPRYAKVIEEFQMRGVEDRK